MWETLTDFEAYPRWNPFIRKITGIVDKGERLTVQMHAGDHTMTFQPTVFVIQPEKELRWLGHLLIPGIFDGEHSFIIHPLGEDRVCLIQRETFKGLLVPLSGSLLDNTERSFNRMMNLDLKERVEQAN